MTWRRAAAVLPGVGVSLLPKLTCPACWPAYAGMVSALGLSFVISARYLLPLTAAFLAIAAAALGFRPSRRRGYGPFWMGLVAAALIMAGKFYFDAAKAMDAGIGLLVAASVWNGWPRRAAAACSCSACVPAGAGLTPRNAKGEETDEAQN